MRCTAATLRGKVGRAKRSVSILELAASGLHIKVFVFHLDNVQLLYSTLQFLQCTYTFRLVHFLYRKLERTVIDTKCTASPL